MIPFLLTVVGFVAAFGLIRGFVWWVVYRDGGDP